VSPLDSGAQGVGIAKVQARQDCQPAEGTSARQEMQHHPRKDDLKQVQIHLESHLEAADQAYYLKLSKTASVRNSSDVIVFRIFVTSRLLLQTEVVISICCIRSGCENAVIRFS